MYNLMVVTFKIIGAYIIAITIENLLSIITINSYFFEFGFFQFYIINQLI